MSNEIVITGASSGIGAAVRASCETRGVVVHDLSRRTTGIDVTDEPAVRAAYDAWRDDPPAWLLASAGISEAVDLFDDDVAHWRRVIDVHVTGAFIVAREHARRLIAAGRPGTIVLVGSPSARRPSRENLSYGVAKAAVAALGLGLARTLEPCAIRVYVIAPSHVDTPLLRRRHGATLDDRDLLPADRCAETIARFFFESDDLDGQVIYLGRRVAMKQQ